MAQVEGVLSGDVDRRLVEHGRQWRQKPAVRKIYFDLYRRMAAACVAGRTLEIGGGSGIFKDFSPDTVTTDILPAPWLDVVADAQRLPFTPTSFDNLVMFDVLHHIEFPRRFLTEAVRVLRPGGRIVMVEPAITPVSWWFYNFLHPEPVHLGADPLDDGEPDPARDPFAANQAIPGLLIGRHRRRLEEAFPMLTLRRRQWLSLVAYPLSGGFKPWCLIPDRIVGPVLALENALSPLVGRLAAFRLLIVLEKSS